MIYNDLREFIDYLEKNGELVRIDTAVSPVLEMTEITDRTLKRQGPALLFTNVIGYDTPVLVNLFGTPRRVALGMGKSNLKQLRQVGELLAFLKEPDPPTGLKDAWQTLPKYKKVLDMAPKIVKNGACQQQIIAADKVDLYRIPIQTCWPKDVAPLITWGLVITKGPHKKRQNLGIYRQQLLSKNSLIMRWLAHRGGALDYKEHQQLQPTKPFPVAVALGCDPATMLAAVTPIPDSLSEYAFAGLLRGARTEVVKCKTIDLEVPQSAEYVLEGYIYPNDTALEGPFGDHTGYYNEVERFPVFKVKCITKRKRAIYHSTYTGKPPDEPAMLGVALNEVFVPILQKQFPEIVDFYLPPEGCSYRLAIVSINKQYPGHAKRVMLGVWSYLRQFMYTKFVIVVDADIDTRNWQEVIWAITTCMDPKRDMSFIENSPIDYLDFASPVVRLGSKVGMDATTKFAGETDREWGEAIKMDAKTSAKIDQIWQQLNIFKD